MSRTLAGVVTGVLLSAACAGPSAPPPGAANAAVAPAPWFEEVAASSGIAFTHRSGHRTRYRLPEIMGGGAALVDIDGDGDLDALLMQSGALGEPDGAGRHRLFRNDGHGRFSDITRGSGVEVPGYGMGVAAGDYDADGDIDLYLTNLGSNVLLQNDGQGRFMDVTAEAGVAGSGWSTSATFVDVDADGRLDLFVTRYLAWSPERERECFSLTGAVDFCSPKNYDAPTSDLLFRNRGDGRFQDVSAPAGLHAGVGNGLGTLASDLDGDGRVDLFVANDGTPNHLWINQGAMRFAESALQRGVAVDQDGAPKAGMGVDAADVDGDGDQDLLVMNLDTESDSYFRNDGRFFVDDTTAVGLRVASRRFTRFGMALLDFDNDGRLDLYEANGRVGLQGETFGTDPYAEPNLLFRGLPGPAFAEVQPRGGTAAPLIATSRAAAFGDVDNDGGVDILVANRDGAPYLLRNVVAARGHWVMFSVRDARGSDALGAVLTIRAGDRVIQREVRSGFSYLAANDPRVHVGLGETVTVASVDVRWIDGRVERFGPFDADQILTVRRGSGVEVRAGTPSGAPPR